LRGKYNSGRFKSLAFKYALDGGAKPKSKNVCSRDEPQ
jgi:hypothetical protein